MPIARVLLGALHLPDQPALHSKRSQRSTHALATDIAAGAHAVGPTPGVVAVTVPDPVDALIAILAIDLAGGTALVCDTQWSPAERQAIWTALRPDRVIDIPLPRASHSVPIGRRAGATTPPWPRALPSDRPWAGFSAGATGRPRAVGRTRASWVDSFAAVSNIMQVGPGARVLLPGSLASSLYCFAAVHALAVGAHVTLTLTPAERVAALAACDIVHTVPAIATDVLDAIEQGVPSTVRRLIVGGSALPSGLRSRAAALGIEVVSYYGSVELSFVAVDEGTGLRAFPGVTIDRRPIPGTARLDEVWVRSPWIADGYLGDVRGPFIRDREWATVGDLAERNSTPLQLRGRGDGAIQCDGATVVPEDVEEALRHVPGVDDVVVIGAPHRRRGSIVAAVVETSGRPGLRAHLDRAARAALTPVQRPVRWYAVAALPRTHGEVARGVVSEWVCEDVDHLGVLR